MGSAASHGVRIVVVFVLLNRIRFHCCVGYLVSPVCQRCADSSKTGFVARRAPSTRFESCCPSHLQLRCRNVCSRNLVLRRLVGVSVRNSGLRRALPDGAFDEGDTFIHNGLLSQLRTHQQHERALCEAGARERKRQGHVRELLLRAEANDSSLVAELDVESVQVHSRAPLPSHADVVVVGGGHSGVEAAVASARLGLKVALFSPGGLASVGRLSCNPSVGGSGKSQLLAEADACGALLPRAADLAASHWRLLGASGGPAAWASRALLNRRVFALTLQRLLGVFENITVYDAAVQRILLTDLPRGSQCGRSLSLPQDAVDREERDAFRRLVVAPAAAAKGERKGLLGPAQGSSFSESSFSESSFSESSFSESSFSESESQGPRACGVRLSCGHEVTAEAVVVATGTFLDAVVSCGKERVPAGRLRDVSGDTPQGRVRKSGSETHAHRQSLSQRTSPTDSRSKIQGSAKDDASSIDSRFGSGLKEAEPAAVDLAASLAALGLEMTYFKTGTPARLAGDSIQWSALEPQPAQLPPRPFSSAHSPQQMLRRFRAIPFRVLCFKAQTNPTTHRLVHEHLGALPVHRRREGVGVGPRYCPSIANKVRSFPDRETHPVWLEPEDGSYGVIYAGGLSGAFPVSVQQELLHSIAPLRHARLLRPAYDVEYLVVLGREIDGGLQAKRVRGLFLSGQIVGTTGYEEAGALGVVAGWNAGLSVLNARRSGRRRSALSLGSGECSNASSAPFPSSVRLNPKHSMMGLLVQQLQTRAAVEPLRMLASRASARLSARSDNAAQRLLPFLLEGGLLAADHPRARRALQVKRDCEKVVTFLSSFELSATSWRQLAQRAAADLEALQNHCHGQKDALTVESRKHFSTQKCASQHEKCLGPEGDAVPQKSPSEGADLNTNESPLSRDSRGWSFVQRICAPQSLLLSGLNVWISTLRLGRRWTAAQLLALLPPSTFYPSDQEVRQQRTDNFQVNRAECLDLLQRETKVLCAFGEHGALQGRLQRELERQRREQRLLEELQYEAADRTGGILLSRDCVALQLLLALILQYAEECFQDTPFNTARDATHCAVSQPGSCDERVTEPTERPSFAADPMHGLAESSLHHGSSFRELLGTLIRKPAACENLCCSIYADTRYGFYLQRQRREAEACASGALFPKEWSWTRQQFPFLSEEEVEYLKTHQPKNLRDAAATGCLRPASAFQLLLLLRQFQKKE